MIAEGVWQWNWVETTQQGVWRGTWGRAGGSFGNYNVIDIDELMMTMKMRRRILSSEDNDDGGQVQFESPDNDDWSVGSLWPW